MITLGKYTIVLLIGFILGMLSMHYLHTKVPTFQKTLLRVMADKTAQRYQISPALFRSLIKAESAWNPKAVSVKDARGLTQVLPQTAKEKCGILNPKDLFNPSINLECGAKILSQHLDEFQDIQLALCAFHAGENKVRELNRCPNFKDTSHYVQTVMANM